MNVNEDVEKLISPIKQQFQNNIGGWLEGREHDFSERLNHVSSAFRKMAEELETHEERELSSLARSGAESLQDVASRIESSDPQELLNVLEEQGRTHPAGAFMTSLVAGFMSSRITKVASQSEHTGANVSTEHASKVDASPSVSESQSFTSDIATPSPESPSGEIRQEPEPGERRPGRPEL